MKVNPKPCKGSGKSTGYGCGTLALVRKYGLCMKCYPQWLYNSEEGQRMIKESAIKATAPREAMAKAFEDEKERKSISYLLVNTRNVCHEYIRLRDKGKPCVSCGYLWDSSHQAGHFWKSELYPSVRFDEFNIQNQCRKCNMFNDGNESGYRERLPLRIGQDEYDKLSERASQSRSVHKWDRDELIRIREYYKQKIKEIK